MSLTSVVMWALRSKFYKPPLSLLFSYENRSVCSSVSGLQISTHATAICSFKWGTTYSVKTAYFSDMCGWEVIYLVLGLIANGAGTMVLRVVFLFLYVIPVSANCFQAPL